MEEGESCSFSQSEQWSTEKLNSLIRLYSEERDLWDTTRYPSFDQRQEAYERIANSLGCEVPDVTRKVRHLRTYYARVLRENSKKKLRRGKRWQFFDQMEFLHDHIILRMTRPICNMQTDASDAQEDSKADTGMSGPDMSESSTDSSMLVPRKHSSSSQVNRAAKRPKHMQRSTANSAGSASSNGPSDDLDADEIFGRHVANELKLIHGMREKQFAKLQINNILFNAQFGLVKLPDHILQSLAELDHQQSPQ